MIRASSPESVRSLNCAISATVNTYVILGRTVLIAGPCQESLFHLRDALAARANSAAGP
jgi:hypothetical protein